jgi:hypothetical protein
VSKLATDLVSRPVAEFTTWLFAKDPSLSKEIDQICMFLYRGVGDAPGNGELEQCSALKKDLTSLEFWHF